MDFTKMHGLGNDFIVMEDIQLDLASEAARLCPRRTSVGADGLIAVCPSQIADIRMRIFNADGSEAEMCGNGVRCFARYVYDRRIVSSPEMSVETLAGIMRPKVLLCDGKFEGVRVDMGRPVFDPALIPANVETPLEYVLDVDGRQLRMSSVLMGVPHAIVVGEGWSEEEICHLGPLIERHSVFPRKTNVNFVEITGPDTLRVRTWERGAGRTMACGTGSCAVAVAAYERGLVGASATVELEAGNLAIEISPNGTVFMTGPAAYVYEATSLANL